MRQREKEAAGKESNTHYLGLELRQELADIADLSVKGDPQISFRAANCKSLKQWEALGLDFGSYEETWVTIQGLVSIEFQS